MLTAAIRDSRVISAVFALGFAFFGAFAQTALADNEPSEADRIAVRTVIEDQMAAFKRNDGAAAYGFASPGIKQMFPDSDTFMDMVRTQYTPVYRPRYVEFGRAVGSENEVVQPVYVIGEDGQSVLALYTLERDGDAAWLITGCVLRPAPADAEPL